MVQSEQLVIALLPGEFWWGGAVADGKAMPFGGVALSRDLARNAGLLHDANSGENQSAPLLLSSAGRVLWCDDPFTFTFADADLVIDSHPGSPAQPGSTTKPAGQPQPQLLSAPGGTLRDAFRLASELFFAPSGTTPALELFTAPQYNTWIEAPFTPTQQDVLSYAHRLLEAGFPPGVLMIDDNWSPGYGDWRFDTSRFPDARGMLTDLHDLGFTVMLWIVPYISPDTAVFRHLRQLGLLLRGADGEVAIRHWWNGYSAVLDLTNPQAVGWLHEQLGLLTDQGVDGFKFDGGDLRYSRDDDLSFAGTGRTGFTEAWAKIGLNYPFNEFRASWKMGGHPLAQRLHDKPTTWGADGLGSLIPEGLSQGLLGYPFNCADMVGGGELTSFVPGASIDQEQFVRYAQCAALFPMMQFSISPARVLDAEHLAAVQAAVALRDRFLPDILALVAHAALIGEPVMRPLAFHYPGLEFVTDQFLLGEAILVAPVLEPGATVRSLVIPPGTWVDENGQSFTEGTVDVPVTLGSVPVFRRS